MTEIALAWAAVALIDEAYKLLLLALGWLLSRAIWWTWENIAW